MDSVTSLIREVDPDSMSGVIAKNLLDYVLFTALFQTITNVKRLKPTLQHYWFHMGYDHNGCNRLCLVHNQKNLCRKPPGRRAGVAWVGGRSGIFFTIPEALIRDGLGKRRCLGLSLSPLRE